MTLRLLTATSAWVLARSIVFWIPAELLIISKAAKR